MSLEPPISAVPDRWPPGTVVKDDYVIERKLGRGGFGTAYLARHRYLDSVHVIKRLHDDFAADETFVKKFIREGQVIRRLSSCPQIVQVEHMTLTQDGYLVLIMEYVGGGSLESLLGSGTPLPVATAVDIAIQMAQGLQAAHDAGLLHRDIKPDNVLLSRVGPKPQAKLIDFGIAADRAATTGSRSLAMGSVGYAAPEQWMSSSRQQDARTDLYALGATLYRMLTGQKPFAEEDVMQFLGRVYHEGPPRPSSVRKDLPLALDNLVWELMATKPEDRPPTAAAVIERLQAVLQPEPQQATLRARTVAAPTPSDSPWRRRTMVIAGMSAVLVLGSWQAWRQFGAAERVAPPGAQGPSFGVREDTALPVKPTPGQSQAPPGGGTAPVQQQRREQASPSAVIQAPKPAPPQSETGLVNSATKQAAKPGGAPPVEQSASQQFTPAPIVETPKPAAPQIDHIREGDAARDRGDFAAAAAHYRQATGGAARLAAMQAAVEGEIEERVSVLSDRGNYGEAERLVDTWIKEFPGSQRLSRQKQLIQRRRESQ